METNTLGLVRHVKVLFFLFKQIYISISTNTLPWLQNIFIKKRSLLNCGLIQDLFDSSFDDFTLYVIADILFEDQC